MSLVCHNARLRVGGEVGLTELTREYCCEEEREREREREREKNTEDAELMEEDMEGKRRGNARRFRSAKEIEGEARHPELFTATAVKPAPMLGNILFPVKIRPIRKLVRRYVATYLPWISGAGGTGKQASMQ